MEQNYVVLQGKIFAVTIPSMIGSTNYRWCLKELPKELMLIATADHPSNRSTAFMGEQVFYLGAVSAENVNVEIGFELVHLANLRQTADTYKAQVKIVPSNSSDFLSQEDMMPVKYGYPCGAAEASKAQIPYGMVYSDTNLKYGYPCGVAEASKAQIPYGMVCSDTNLKYGYPCGVMEAGLKYGFPGCM